MKTPSEQHLSTSPHTHAHHEHVQEPSIEPIQETTIPEPLIQEPIHINIDDSPQPSVDAYYPPAAYAQVFQESS